MTRADRAARWVTGLAITAVLAAGCGETTPSEAAPELAQQGTTVEPFALRALGVARHDDELLARADERFTALGLAWHRAQTERLLDGLGR